MTDTDEKMFNSGDIEKVERIVWNTRTGKRPYPIGGVFRLHPCLPSSRSASGASRPLTFRHMTLCVSID
jgi:hypothetical protein